MYFLIIEVEVTNITNMMWIRKNEWGSLNYSETKQHMGKNIGSFCSGIQKKISHKELSQEQYNHGICSLQKCCQFQWRFTQVNDI